MVGCFFFFFFFFCLFKFSVVIRLLLAPKQEREKEGKDERIQGGKEWRRSQLVRGWGEKEIRSREEERDKGRRQREEGEEGEREELG